MAQQVYRANLLSANFPFLSENFGRTVIVGNIDQNVAKSADPSGQDKTHNAGIPQMYYCHNVMPSQQGIQSISYSQRTAAVVGLASNFVGVISLRDALGNSAYLGYTYGGDFYIAKAPFDTWQFVVTIPEAVNKLVTRAYAQGVTYIYVANSACYRYDFSTDQLVEVTLNGLTASAIKGVTSLAGYLIVWSDDTVAWSAAADPTDFLPSLSTGAGSGAVEGAAGSILVCAAAHAGLLAYTTGNVIAVTYTGNAQFPFIFRALPNSGGLKSATHIDYDSQAGQQYAYTTSGFQLFDVQKAQTVLSDLTDFIAGSVFETCDAVSGIFTKTTLSANASLVKAIKFIANRYLVASYGITSFTHAIVYDTQLKRFGKLKINHVQCTDLLLGEDSHDVPRSSIGFLQTTGAIKYVNFDANAAASDAVALLGKYQLSRSHTLQLLGVELENVEAGDDFTLRDFLTIDGKNATQHTLSLTEEEGMYRRYDTRLSAKNHSLMLTGAFSLNSLILTFSLGGRR